MIRSNTCPRADEFTALMGPNTLPGQLEVHGALGELAVEYGLTVDEARQLIRLARRYSMRAPEAGTLEGWAARTTTDQKRIAAKQVAIDPRIMALLAMWNLHQHPIVVGILNRAVDRKRISGPCQ